MNQQDKFTFATGIECSYPTIPDGKGGRKRIDELEKCGHYRNWQQDFHLVRELGIDFLRFGGPYYRIHRGPGKYDWDWLDETLQALKDMGITPILDLCHFGVPDWIGDFQNREWPHYFAEFARACAKRYEWVQYFTPVNEIFVTALYSGQYGYWNEALTTHEGFVRALLNLCRANVMAMNAIVDVRRDVQFIQSESTQFYHARKPEELEIAYFMNEKRFLSLDLTYAFPLTAGMYRFLMDHGMEEEEFDWFQNQTIKAHCIMGSDYYARNEQVVGQLPKIGERKDPHEAERRKDGGDARDTSTLGYYALAKQYYDRYKLPIMHTETNMAEPDAVAWLWQNWSGVFRLYQEGVPIQGFTWYSLIDQVDWDSALTNDAGHVNPYGLYDIDRNIRPVGKAYKELIGNWKGKFPCRAAYLRQSRW